MEGGKGRAGVHVPPAPLKPQGRRPTPGRCLADFGFASRCSLKTGLMSTFCGSVAYTAPEILMSKKYNGELADLWSL